MGERHSGMLTACVLVVALSPPGTVKAAAQTSPLSGAWSEEVVPGTDRPPWGSRFTTIHDGSRFTVIGPDGVSTFVLDGTARDTQVAMSSCSSTLRRIEAELRGGEVIITESIVTRSRGNAGAHSPCLFDDGEEPGLSTSGLRRGAVALDTVTVVSRQGQRLAVEVTRRGARGPVTTRAVYQPASK